MLEKHILKKLIFREWYRFFLTSVFLLLLLMTIANLISGFLRSNVSAMEVIMNYIIELPGYSGKILPLSCLMASLFSINKLQNRNELTAIFALECSRKNFILTIFQASFLVCLLQFFISAYVQPFFKMNKNFLIPKSAYKFRNLESRGLRASTIGSGKIWYRSGNYFFSFSTFNHEEKTLNELAIYQFGKDHKLINQIKAQKAVYKNGVWQFKNGVSHLYLDNKHFPQLNHFKSMNYTLKESPDDFEQIESDITTLNIFELHQYISNLSEAGINTNEYKVMFLDKISSAIICFILGILASIGIFNPNRRTSSFGKNILFVLAFTIIYWLIYSYSYELGKSSKVDPYIACFIMPFTFISFLAFYFYKHRKIH